MPFRQPSASSAASSASSSNSIPTLSRLAIRSDPEQDEGDAWTLDSDDEDSTAKQQWASIRYQRPNAGYTASQPRMSSMMAGPATKRIPSMATTTSAAGAPPKHAPPARPHPFPLLSSHQQRSASASATLPTTSSLSSNSVNSGWTMVGSGSATSSSRDVGGSELGSSSDAELSTTNGRGKSHSTTDATRAGGGSSICFAGSPPTDVGSTAAEAVLQASMSGLSPVSSDVDAASPETRTSLSNINTGVEKKQKREAIESASTIRHNYLDIVKDPFAALDSLMLSSSSADVALNPPTPSSSDPMTPSSALERQTNHVQQLGRGFNDLRSPGASPLPTPTPRSASQSIAARKFARADSFDPMTMAGDGIIMSGTRWGNSRSNLNKQGSTSSRDSNDEDNSLYEALPSNDPTRSSIEAPVVSSSPRSSATLGLSPGVGLRREKSVRTKRRWREFYRSLQCESASAQRPSSSSSTSSGVDVSKLRELAWNGIPSELRTIVWPMLLGYLPPQASTRSTTLARKREEYRKAVQLAFGQDPFVAQGSSTSSQTATPPTAASPAPLAPSSSGRGTPIGGRSRGSEEEKLWHQISIDVPRTNPRIPLWQRPTTQRSLERLLYVWAIRHHATGYVQGMSDLATPFYQVFLSIYLQDGGSRADVVEDFDTTHLPKEILLAVEADSYWCLGKLLDGIQENYIHNQPGIIRQVRRMEELVGRIDAPLHLHLRSESVEYIQFAFRWMNCLLMREMSLPNVTRLWDTYLAEGPDAFSDFHLYVCSVFLCKWSKELQGMDFQGCIMFLQSLPTEGWSDKDAELLLSEAFLYKNLFGQTRHLGD